jgi:hypothetical protein
VAEGGIELRECSSAPGAAATFQPFTNGGASQANPQGYKSHESYCCPGGTRWLLAMKSSGGAQATLTLRQIIPGSDLKEVPFPFTVSGSPNCYDPTRPKTGRVITGLVLHYPQEQLVSSTTATWDSIKLVDKDRNDRDWLENVPTRVETCWDPITLKNEDLPRPGLNLRAYVMWVWTQEKGWRTIVKGSTTQRGNKESTEVIIRTRHMDRRTSSRSMTTS